jgi:hypothetical protein
MSTGLVILVAIVLAGLILVVVALTRRRGPDDHVDSFRRQIDALSPQARRPTIGTMKPPEQPAADDDGGDVP